MTKRNITKYALATAYTGLMGAAVVNSYNRIGTEPDPMTAETLKKGIVVASLLTGMVWTISML